MVRIALLTAALLGTACAERSLEPIAVTPHGDAVRHNLMVHVIDPNPSSAHLPPSDGARAALGVDAYRTGEVKDPIDTSTSPSTIRIEGVN